jgi:hypothetical protein
LRLDLEQNSDDEEVVMSDGQEHNDRRVAQARAAAKPENKDKARKYPGKGNRGRWKKEI